MRYVLANWKMYPRLDEATSLLEDIQSGLRARPDASAGRLRLVVCPPFVALPALRAAADHPAVRLGAQTCHWEDRGPHTGEVSPRMLRGLVEYVLVGHSERRAAGETDDQVARKVAAIAWNGMVPILFVGEDVRGGDAIAQTERRLREGLAQVDVATQPVLVVYEPSWAIGAEEAAPAEEVRRAVDHLKGSLTGMGATEPTILYGGTVTVDNVDELAGIDVLDGVGATRASLDTDILLHIVDRVLAP